MKAQPPARFAPKRRGAHFHARRAVRPAIRQCVWIGIDADHPTAEALKEGEWKADVFAKAAVDEQRLPANGGRIHPPAAVAGTQALEAARQAPFNPASPEAALESPPV